MRICRIHRRKLEDLDPEEDLEEDLDSGEDPP
jgi:hypothetical protein